MEAPTQASHFRFGSSYTTLHAMPDQETRSGPLIPLIAAIIYPVAEDEVLMQSCSHGCGLYFALSPAGEDLCSKCFSQGSLEQPYLI
jgi:hypothetical protein